MSVKLNTRKNKQLQNQKRKRTSERQLTYLVAGAAALFALLIGLIIFVSIQRSQPIAGEVTVATLGNTHISPDRVVDVTYNSAPPTSGPHFGSLAEWGIYTDPVPYQVLLHNLEDGGVVLYYQCPQGCSEEVEQLTTLVQGYLDVGKRLVLAPNDPAWSSGGASHADMETRFALTAWNRILKSNVIDAQQIRAFIQKYEGIDHHGVRG